jgi:mannan endo-1,4-beta-mannosidase
VELGNSNIMKFYMPAKFVFKHPINIGFAIFLAASFLLSGCSGGGGGGSGNGGSGSAGNGNGGSGSGSGNVTIGGTLSGLASSQQVILQDNGGNALTVTSNGAFTFSASLASSTSYSVTVSTQPSGQICTVANGSGTATANISNVLVSCVTAALLVQNNQLLDSKGKVVLFRAVNVPVYQSGYADDLVAVANAVKSSGANAVRLVWWGNTANGWTAGAPTYYTLTNLDTAIQTYANLGILPIIELHDVTCYLAVGLTGGGAPCNDTTIFANRITGFWTSPSVVALIKKHQNHLIVDLANEWGSVYSASDEANFTGNYVSAISAIRTAWANGGVGNLPLMVDAPNGGTDVAAFTDPSATAGKTNGQLILAADPLGNTMFSVHSYWAAVDGITHANIDSYMSLIANSNLSFVLGEVGAFADGVCANTVDHQYVLNAAYAQNLGTIAWAWYQDGTCSPDATNLTPDGITIPATSPGSLSFQNLVLYSSRYGLVTAASINFGP